MKETSKEIKQCGHQYMDKLIERSIYMNIAHLEKKNNKINNIFRITNN